MAGMAYVIQSDQSVCSLISVKANSKTHPSMTSTLRAPSFDAIVDDTQYLARFSCNKLQIFSLAADVMSRQYQIKKRRRKEKKRADNEQKGLVPTYLLAA
jgi:hypothetical protein